MEILEKLGETWSIRRMPLKDSKVKSQDEQKRFQFQNTF